MGYSGGEDILDPIAELTKKIGLTDDQRYQILSALVNALGEADWDTWYMGDKQMQADPILARVYQEFYDTFDEDAEK